MEVDAADGSGHEERPRRGKETRRGLATVRCCTGNGECCIPFVAAIARHWPPRMTRLGAGRHREGHAPLPGYGAVTVSLFDAQVAVTPRSVPTFVRLSLSDLPSASYFTMAPSLPLTAYR